MATQDDSIPYEVAIRSSVGEIDAGQWNALLAADDLPFLEWEWYAALELSGSISVESGWQGAHIVVSRDGRAVAIAPLYAKMHSWGELAFDHAWQSVARQVGVDYFPKLVGMVPATPCSGYRFLIAADQDWQTLTGIIVHAIGILVDKWHIKTVAFNFVEYRWAQQMAAAGYAIWSHSGFSWRNRDFTSFEMYRQQFTKNQRRNIRRECDALSASGFKIEILPGSAAPRRYFDIMHRYYLATNEKFGPFAALFLNRAFFDHVAHRYAHRILLVCCFRYGELALPYSQRTPAAMAMLIYKNDSLYGRYWGCEQDVDMVHFNVCYYAPIAWAIERGYRYFDPGIGGEHKLRRGFEADERYTLLRFTDSTMQTILERNQEQINESVTDYTTLINKERPLAPRIID